jgi:uncharacterized protein (TIGR00730 family)
VPGPTTGDAGLDKSIEDLLDELGPIKHRSQHRRILHAAVMLAQSDTERVDVKIASAALDEMVRAFAVFRPYAGIPKVTIFGSARTQSNDAEYLQAKELASEMADEGWMVVTGAGPGIMQAASEGAGRDMALGVSIRLPFESEANEIIAGGDKLIAMRYFFTRKLMLVKESKAYVSLPGGFGTLDETFELLTLQQVGKADPAPIVLLDIPGGQFWHLLDDFVEKALERRGLISDADRKNYLITDSLSVSIDEIKTFYSNYHSIRYVGDRLVIRAQTAPSEQALTQLNADFGHLLESGLIESRGPLAAETRDKDELDLARLVFRYGNRHYGKLRPLIDRINAYAAS